jgi:hypothetical protein
MAVSGSRTMIAGSYPAVSLVPHQSCRFSQSFGPRRSCVGTGPVFVATGVGSRPLGGRPQIETELRALIRRMSVEIRWGVPRIHGELLARV